MVRPARAVGLAVLALALALLALNLHLGWEFVAGRFTASPYQHPAPGLWRWQPWIHPPLYGEYMRLLEGISDRLWVGEELLFFWSGGVLGAAAVIGGAHLAGRAMGPAWALLAAGLLALSPTTLRPFENYPPGKLLVLLVLVALWELDRRAAAEPHEAGGPPVRRLVAGTVLLAWTAVELHLSCWFVLGPLWFFLAVSLRGPRRRLHLLGIGAWLLAFFATTWPGLFEVLEEGPGIGRLGDGGCSADHLTFEWSNPWLLAPLVLWAVPSLRRGRRFWVAASAACVLYVGITWGLMACGQAIGGPRMASHHYFELVDVPLVLCALAALHAAAARWGASPRGRALLLAAAAGLLLSQAAHFRLTHHTLRRWALEKLETTQPFVPPQGPL